jgi:hypothetical protein
MGSRAHNYSQIGLHGFPALFARNIAPSAEMPPYVPRLGALAEAAAREQTP